MRLICIITTLILLSIGQAIAQNNREDFVIEKGQVHQVSFVLEHPTRISYQLFNGHTTITVLSEGQTVLQKEQSFVQLQLKQEYLSKTITIKVDNGPGVGAISRQIISQYELLSTGQSKMMSLELQQFRIIQIHPRKFTRLAIEKYEGLALFTNNRCMASEKQDCFYELERLEANKMERSVQVLSIDACLSCLVLIKIEAKERTTIIRLSLESDIYILASLPSVAVLKANEVQAFKVYGQPAQKGKVICYSGQIKINSLALITTKLDNGFTYELPASHNYSTPFEVSLQGVEDLSYVYIEAPTSQNPIALRDGLPQTFQIKPNATYIARVDKHNSTKGNFILSSTSAFLSDLNIRFVDKQFNLHYAVRPQFLFKVNEASQNFQLDNSTGVIELEIKNIGKQSGQLNMSASMSEVMTLPYDWKQSNILVHGEVNYYLIEAISSPVVLTVQKCVECHLRIGYGNDLESIVAEEIEERVFKKEISPEEDYLFVKVTSNNYAFYSIVVQTEDEKDSVVIQNPKLGTYLTEPDSHLELQFTAPKCGQSYCSDVKYYIVEGSNRQHVASRAYCPNVLFDFDERTKDIVFQRIEVKQVRDGVFSYVRPLKHRDWLLVAAEVGQEVVSYDIVNTGEIREYNNMRWPFFYFALFITFAVFISFVLFMSLRRPKSLSEGYIRGATAVSQEDLQQ